MLSATFPSTRRTRRPVMGFLLLSVAAGAHAAAPPPGNRDLIIPKAEWKSFRPPAGGCSILMPGNPSYTPVKIGDFNMHKYPLMLSKQKLAFILAFMDVTPAAGRVSLRKAADAERDNIRRKLKGKVTDESAIRLGPHPGREFQIRAEKETVIARLYLVRKGKAEWFYLLMAEGKSIRPGKGDAAKFFGSFKLEEDAAKPAGKKTPPGPR